MARAVLIMEAVENENLERRRRERLTTARLQRSLRDQAAPINQLSDAAFISHYRLSKELFVELCHELGPYLSRSRRSTKISVECKVSICSNNNINKDKVNNGLSSPPLQNLFKLNDFKQYVINYLFQVLTALSFYATGSYQKLVSRSYLHSLSQPSVSNAVREVTMALNNNNILREHIRFPQTRREREIIINGFFNKFGFPGCMGCIDCTHVALVRPNDHEERFFNRKHYHSRNVQIICDSDLNILNVDACFGGATHDAYIWRNCEIPRHLKELHRNGENVWLLGDSGYPLRPWLLTPIVNAEPNSAENHYTHVHCLTRNTVERCIGVLKARWRCLLAHRVLHYKHNMVAKIINACTVLHNIANRHRLPIPELQDEEMVADVNLQVPLEEPPRVPEDHDDLESGRQQRSLIVLRLSRARDIT